MADDLNNQQKKIVRKALDDTIDTIVKTASTALFEHCGVDVRVPEAQKRVRRDRYRESYTAAVQAGREWDGANGDKEQVLERAEEVGHLAGILATGNSLYQELKSAGVGSKPGQLV